MIRYGHAVPTTHIEVVKAGHPAPDAAGETAARRILELVQELTAADLVACLISGGGSALLPLPLPGVTLEDKQALNKALLRSGATISEMNCVRRHLSAVKGSQLGAAGHPGRVVTLLISDAPCEDAIVILNRYRIEAAPAVMEVLTSGCGESIKPNDERLARTEARIIATPQMALDAAVRGGRNVEFLLSLGLGLEGFPGIHALAGDTDGVDGSEDAAGAYWGPDSVGRAWALGINPHDRLAANDGHGFFEALGDAVVTGPTLTNVNDFRAVLIAADTDAGPTPPSNGLSR